ncbi:MAG: hypothetical protein QJR02_08560 [Sinobacteraceae bacterium]|nr:hypothetical protein [Nevskiaceae bacterium]
MGEQFDSSTEPREAPAQAGRDDIPLRMDFPPHDIRVPMLPAFPPGFGTHASASMQTYRALLRAMAMEVAAPMGGQAPWFVNLPWVHGDTSALLAALDLHVRANLPEIRRMPVESVLQLLSRPRVIRRLAGSFVCSGIRFPAVPLRPLSSLKRYPAHPHEEKWTVDKCIYPCLPLEHRIAAREREFLRWAEHESEIQALCRLHVGHPFPELPYCDPAGHAIAYRPRYLLRTRTTLHLVDLDPVGDSARDTIRYWCRLINTLPPTCRDGLRWLHAPLAHLDLAAWRQQTELHVLLVRAAFACLPDVPAGRTPMRPPKDTSMRETPSV